MEHESIAQRIINGWRQRLARRHIKKAIHHSQKARHHARRSGLTLVPRDLGDALESLYMAKELREWD